MVGGANRHKDALSVSPAEKEILIPQKGLIRVAIGGIFRTK
jgi:hypothetical protein